MKDKFREYVLISPTKENNYINVEWAYTVFYKRMDDGGFSCYIPAYDIHFSAKDFDAVKVKSNDIMFIYFDHFFIHKKNGLKLIALQLHKLGFKTSNDMMTMKELVKNHVVVANFKPNKDIISPPEFVNAAAINQKAEREMAI
ncbi:MAG: hypothetical protein ACYDCN_03025 [Bacteroidia bacterium]